jgi:hypothetical protein
VVATLLTKWVIVSITPLNSRAHITNKTSLLAFNCKIMYIQAKLVFQHYVPEDYSNLLFLSMRKNDVPFIYSLENLRDAEKYIEINGYPVKPWIIEEGNPNLSNSDRILANPDQIGWFDEGEHCDELCDIEIKHINNILEHDNGYIFIEVDEDDDVVLFQDKVVLTYSEPDDEYEIDEDADDPIDDDYNEIY